MAKVVVVDDDEDIRDLVVAALEPEGYDVTTARDGLEGFDVVMSTVPDVAILDIGMPYVDGLDLLRRLRPVVPSLPVVMLSAAGDLSTAVEAMRSGAYDYVAKPFEVDDLVIRIGRAVDWGRLRVEIEDLRREVAAAGTLRTLVGPSAEMQELVARVAQVADTPLTVLIRGETGTGKELVARAIYEQSSRCDGPFVAVDCGAIPDTLVESVLFGHERGAFTGADHRREGRFELAARGVLFLDEVENLPLAAQAKLLRALQEREVWPVGARVPVKTDARVVAATNRSVDTDVAAGRFRADLFYRLNEFTIDVPPLRARPADVLPLARRFLVEACMELERTVHGLSPEAKDALLAYEWPGNVRELRNVIRRAALLARDVVHAADLELRGGPRERVERLAEPETAVMPLKTSRERAIAETERRAISAALQMTRGRKSEAARLLHVDFKTLQTKIKRYGISPAFG